ncbi:MAG: hypothetical protein KME05_18575 [Gloeocapsa sp. UFS-A4-WI-NPMV-4B04]|nr:hypothetical protein [Gloeocapsa sp. UFS-A4-WI-NPMV-4B04]
MSKIDGDSADNRPVGSGMVIPEGSSIFGKNHIFNLMQTVLNSPMSSEFHPQISS